MLYLQYQSQKSNINQIKGENQMYRTNYRERTPEEKQRIASHYQRKIEASYFPVEKVSMGESGKFAIVNKENMAKLSEVSKRYTLVRNIDVFKPFVEQFGYENIEKFYGYGGHYGSTKYYHMEIKTGRRFNFGTEEKPDWIDETLVISNSYNKTRSFTFRLGAFRWVCSNGLYSGRALVNYKKIHVGEIPVQKLVFQALLKYQDNSFDNWKRLKEVPLTLEKRLSIIDNMKVFNEKDKEGKEIESNMRLNRAIRYTAKRRITNNSNDVDNQANGWGLYNQINYAVDYEIRGNSQVERRITANKTVEDYLLSEVVNRKESFGIYLN
jgi:hypothetical protein